MFNFVQLLILLAGKRGKGKAMKTSLHKKKSKMGQITIRPFSESDVAEAMKLKERADWNQTEKDWQRLINLDPQGSFAACLDGRVIGTVTTITYGRKLSWIGMMLVDSLCRRCGIGTGLMQTALHYLDRIGVASIKLNATPAGRPLYESLGFRAEGRIERWAGNAPCIENKDRLKIDSETRPAIDEFDRQAFGVDRRVLLDFLMADCPVKPLMDKAPDGRLEGYALARPGSEAFYLGPIVAGNKEAALSLLDGMLSQLVGKTIYLDFNTGFGLGTEVLTHRGLVKQRDLAQMHFGQESSAGTSSLIFGIAGPELG
jgi:predicted N-acetyltransferase YhbS